MNIFINDRSDLNQVVAIIPAGHPQNPSGVAISRTRLEELRASPHRWHRRDVVLINCTRSGKEYTIEVTPTGYAGDLWIIDMLTEEHHERLEGIARRMRANAKAHGEATLLLAGA